MYDHINCTPDHKGTPVLQDDLTVFRRHELEEGHPDWSVKYLRSIITKYIAREIARIARSDHGSVAEVDASRAASFEASSERATRACGSDTAC